MSLKGKLYVGAIIASGVLPIAVGLRSWHSTDLTMFLAILSLGIVTSLLKVTISGIHGSMSMNFIFIMLGVTRLSLGEALCVGLSIDSEYQKGKVFQKVVGSFEMKRKGQDSWATNLD